MEEWNKGTPLSKIRRLVDLPTSDLFYVIYGVLKLPPRLPKPPLPPRERHISAVHPDGRVYLPMFIAKKLKLQPGQIIRWETMNADEGTIRITVTENKEEKQNVPA